MIPAVLLAAAALAAAVPAAPVELTAPGPNGPLAGTLIDPGREAPAVLILPGSGPTDRDGNSPVGLHPDSYRLLAQALAARGVAALRVDKRGMFGSTAAVPDPNAVTIADYAADARAWTEVLRAKTGRRCVWLLGHSEGALVALAAARQAQGVCGVVLVAAPGRPLAEVMREQFRANPANAPIVPQAMATIGSLEQGRRVAADTLTAPLSTIFNDKVQGFLIDLFRQRPAAEAAALTVPLLIVQGEADLQVSPADARALAAAQPRATLVLLPRVTHLMKVAAGDDRAANLATYTDPLLPIAPGVVEAVASFVTARR